MLINIMPIIFSFNEGANYWNKNKVKEKEQVA